MKKLIAVGVAAVIAATVALTATAEASYTTHVACWGGWGGTWQAAYKVKPTRCMFNGDASHAQSTPIENMRWRSWGGPTACGRGVMTYNQGYRARTRFCLYMRRPDGYGRIRGVVSSRYCISDGRHRRCGLRQKPHRYTNWTL